MSSEAIQVPIEQELDALFGSYVTAQQSQGLAYGLVTDEGLVHSAGFGAVDEDGSSPDADTVFPIASMTKSFVACAALIARDRGLLSLEDPITTFFPEFTGRLGTEEPIDPPTVGMLLSMSGGLTEDNSWVDPFIDATEDQVHSWISRGVRYSHLPGTTYEYSNLGYALAGLAVGQAAGRPIQEFVRDEVLQPLGLTSTYFDTAIPQGVRRATGYSLDDQARWVPYPFASSGAFAAAGGIVSTVHDLAIWVSWLASAYAPAQSSDDSVLSRAGRREMQRLRILDQPAVTLTPEGSLAPSIGGYGLGLRISEDLQRGTLVSHGGGLPGFKLFMLWHPDSVNGVVVLTNSHRGDPAQLCHQALGRVLARNTAPAHTVHLWPETVSLRSAAEDLIRNWDSDLANQIFADNVDFDRPLPERRAEIERLIAEVGPLAPPRPVEDIVSAVSPADVTWSIPAKNGELLCMIHLTPVEPAEIQEFVVQAVPAATPRSAAPIDISPRRAQLGDAFLTPTFNGRIVLP